MVFIGLKPLDPSALTLLRHADIGCCSGQSSLYQPLKKGLYLDPIPIKISELGRDGRMGISGINQLPIGDFYDSHTNVH